PVNVRHGINRSIFVVNGEYRRPSFSEPVNAGDVMTVFGWFVISSKVKHSSSRPWARSRNDKSVCFSNASQARTAIFPFVVDDNVSTASDARNALLISRQPSPTPPSIVPSIFLSLSYSGLADHEMPFAPSGFVSTFGPSAFILS